jgi:hypothetical protein
MPFDIQAPLGAADINWPEVFGISEEEAMRVHMSRVFDNLEFPKKGAEIVAKAETKLGELREKIAGREALLSDLAKELKLESAVDVLIHADDLDNRVTNAAGTSAEKAKLRNALGKLREEREICKELEMLIRNLPREETFRLTFESLQYFGF